MSSWEQQADPAAKAPSLDAKVIFVCEPLFVSGDWLQRSW